MVETNIIFRPEGTGKARALLPVRRIAHSGSLALQPDVVRPPAPWPSDQQLACQALYISTLGPRFRGACTVVFYSFRFFDRLPPQTNLQKSICLARRGNEYAPIQHFAHAAMQIFHAEMTFLCVSPSKFRAFGPNRAFFVTNPNENAHICIFHCLRRRTNEPV